MADARLRAPNPWLAEGFTSRPARDRRPSALWDGSAPVAPDQKASIRHRLGGFVDEQDPEYRPPYRRHPSGREASRDRLRDAPDDPLAAPGRVQMWPSSSDAISRYRDTGIRCTPSNAPESRIPVMSSHAISTPAMRSRSMRSTIGLGTAS